jgi:hypothetical protein
VVQQQVVVGRRGARRMERVMRIVTVMTREGVTRRVTRR